MEENMDVAKGKEKKISILKKLESYISRNRAKSSTKRIKFSKSRSWNCTSAKPLTPSGCFSVYVGPEKQRFVIKAKYANHPLFKILLEDAELEYGFNSKGPLMLPCDVDLFWKILAQMDRENEESDDLSCGGFAHGSCSPFHRSLGSRTSSYNLITPPQTLKMNHF